MASVGFDLNRPAVCRTLPGGSWVGMYFDEPGVYYGQSGGLVDDAQARLAGFDIEGDRRESEKRQKLAAAKERIEQEYHEKKSQIEEALDREAATVQESLDDSGLVRIERGSPGGPGGIKRYKYSVIESMTGRVLMKDVTRRDAEQYAQEVNARGYVSIPEESHP